jgi:hypothetical protein
MVPAALIGLLALERRQSARLIAAYMLLGVLIIATWSIVARINGSVITNIGALLGFLGFRLSSVAARELFPILGRGDVILMDLRGFSEKTAGGIFLLHQLASQERLLHARLRD